MREVEEWVPRQQGVVETGRDCLALWEMQQERDVAEIAS